eukprot:TRINITY_DN620_c0_g1_i2.p1 TRINITY_DN620_c0_g1~~TRINITY_DN620_c0_g1_i2.p1  ORF type:complete len:211 (-),score=72.97 TRINITY_DN620_c0_g1_i2:39-671(-)
MAGNNSLSDQDFGLRFVSLSASLSTPAFQQKVQAWQTEKTLLLRNLKELWREMEKEFSEFWSSEEDKHFVVKMATLAAAVEEIPVELGAFMPVVCPEIATILEKATTFDNPDPNPVPEGSASSGSVVDLIKCLVSMRENDSNVFDFADLSAALFGQKEMANPVLAIKSMKIVRSLVLIQFGVSLCLMFPPDEEDYQEGEGEGEGEDEVGI